MSRPASDATDALKAALDRALALHVAPGTRIEGLAPLAGGACQENARLDLVHPDGRRETLVLRGDAPASLPGSLRRADEHAVVQAAVAAGVGSPAPRWLLPDLLGAGRDAWLMDHRQGEALGRRVVHHPRYAAARQVLVDQVADDLAALRRVTPHRNPELPLPAPDGDPARGALAFSRQMLDALPTPQPALELVLAWLDQHQPPPPAEPCLVHGDLRTGNLLVDEEGLVALLDYEFAHWGDPVEDIAWLCVRDWRFGRLDRAAGGFATRAALLAAVKRATGQEVDPVQLHWWEILGNLRWAIGSLYQGERFLSGQVLDLELLAIPWRSAEMAYEALRLVAVGPDRSGRLEVPAGPRLPEGAAAPTRPDEATVLRASALFLEQDLRHHVADRAAAFRARIAAHLLTVVATWQEVGAQVLADDATAYASLLGHRAAGQPATILPELRAALCRRLRSGELAAAAALPVLAARLRAELAVRSPTFDPDATVD